MMLRVKRCWSVGWWMAVWVRFLRGGLICRGGRRSSVRWVWWRRRERGGFSVSGSERSEQRGVRRGAQASAKTEVWVVSGQLALVMGEETVVGAAVWETLTPAAQREIVLGLARLLARLVEGERDE
jgi:hypothetical protein